MSNINNNQNSVDGPLKDSFDVNIHVKNKNTKKDNKKYSFFTSSSLQMNPVEISKSPRKKEKYFIIKQLIKQINEEEFKIDSNTLLNPSDFSRRKSPDILISKSPKVRNDDSV